MGLNDYPQIVNDKMTMTTNDNVGWFRYASTLPSLGLHSYGGGKVNPKWDETHLTCPFVG